MKNLLLLSLLAVATVEASAQTTPAQTDPSTTSTNTAADAKKSAKERRADRKVKAPQVYKGTVAEQNRLVTDAAGAEGDQDSADGTTKTKKAKHKSKD